MADDELRAGELTTANYGWIKPTVGDSDDAWGGYLNSDLDGIDSAVHSIQTSVPAASSTTPAMDGTAAVGTGTTYARADHVHPSDTTKYNTSNPSGYQTAAQVTAALPVASSITPVMDGTAAVGAGTTWARADHVHPSDTTRLPAAGVTNGSDAPPGQIGEVISSNVTTGVSITNVTNANVTSISLTPGDWDVYGEVWYAFSATGASNVQATINPVSVTFPAASAIGTARAGVFATTTGAGPIILNLRPCRISLTITTTYYLIAEAAFSSGTCTATGNIIARRVR